MNLIEPLWLVNVIISLILIAGNINQSYCSFGFGNLLPSGFGSFGSALYKGFDRFIGCSFSECCSTENGRRGWISLSNTTDLAQSFNQHLHGQHLVKKVILQSLKAHFDSHNPSKALVLSFHGWTGAGKNFASKMIAESIFKKGMGSKFVHLFSSTIQFPHEDEADIYKLQIQDWIRGNVSECEHSLFIFDEIDKMPVKMIDGIKPFIDYHDQILGINFRKSIFLFLSNTGGREIVKKMLWNWKEGNERVSITYASMEDLVLKGAFNEAGGLHESDLIQHSLIDFYVPFLPLERKHVELCIKDELQRRNVTPTPELFRKVLDGMLFFPPETRLYSTKGCKSVSTKVGYLLAEEYFSTMFSDEL